jgi:hypothetical protein
MAQRLVMGSGMVEGSVNIRGQRVVRSTRQGVQVDAKGKIAL